MSVRFGWVSHRVSPACLPRAGEGTAPTSEAAAGQPDDPRPQPEPEPDAEKDFQEFVVVPRFCAVDRELSAKEGRLILKWMNKI
jgi:hypothetical protein